MKGEIKIRRKLNLRRVLFDTQRLHDKDSIPHVCFLRPHDRADHNVYKIVPLCFMVTLSQSFNWTLVCAGGSVWVLTGHAGLQQQRREKRSQSFT